MSDDQRFREVNDYAGVHGFAAGFPNFHQADYGGGVVYGTILLHAADVEWRDVPRTDYGVFHIENVPAMFRAANDYAARIGYPAAFPNFHQADHGQGVVYGTILIKPGASEWRDVLRDELGVFQIEDVGGMMRAANDYAARQGFAAAFPTFHQADYGQGVVCGIVLLRPGKAFWRDVHADFLALYSRPPTRWAIILCNLSDVPPGRNARDRYVQYFTDAGAGTSGAFDYWRDISYGTDGLRGAEVFGFFDIGHTRAELNAFAGQAQRHQIFTWGLNAAHANGVDLSSFPHKVVLLNVSADHGKAGGGVVFAYEDTRPLEPTFFAHEMGHELGLDHSFSEQATPCAGGDGRPGAYCDVYDIMSAMNVRSFQDAQNRRTGPSLNALSRERLGWLHRSRVWSPRTTDVDETITLAALNRPEVEGFLLAKFHAPGSGELQTESTYTVELREAARWDRGLGSTRVLLHEVRMDGLVRLLTNANGGVLAVGQEFVTPAPSTVVRLEAMNEPAATATLRVRRLPPTYRTVVRYSNIIKMRHFLTTKTLHSHPLNYSHPNSSKQQQVTCFGGLDDNDWWRIKGAHGTPTGHKADQPVLHGDVVRLEHVLTRRNLHSHGGIPSPITKQQEVTCFGTNGVGDGNDNWRVEVEGGGQWAYGKRLRLIHVSTNHALHSHEPFTHPTYTAGQQEVTGFPGRDDNDLFFLFEGGVVGAPIRAKHSNKVLDVTGISTANGARIQQYNYLGGDNQLFRIESVGGGYYRMVAQHSGKVLDVVGVSTANGARIQQYDWLGGDNQKWRLEPLGDGYYRIVAKHSGKVLDVVGNSTANGAQIQQYDWSGGNNQRWKL